jgi:PPOX class probable F420-dependent enzyme
MQTGPLPQSLKDFLLEPNPAVIATVRSDGRPQCVPTWYEYGSGQILVNMDVTRLRLKHMRANANIAMSIMWHKHWFRHVSIIGQVTALYDDVGMVDLDRLSMRYIGVPYRKREQKRVSAKLAIAGWLAWDASTFKTDGIAKAQNQFER